MRKLKKGLRFVDAFSIASGAMISSGLFILPGIGYAQAGPAVVVSYMAAGLLALTGMLSQAELVSAMPKAGGTYFCVTRSMGPAIGTVVGIITWFSLSLKSAFALVGMAAFAKFLVPADIHLIAALLCVFFIILNLIGIKEAGNFQTLLVFGLLGILVIFILKGFPAVTVRHFEPFSPGGWSSIFSTAGLVFVSYGGLLKVASVAEEVRDPARTVPLAMMVSLFIVGVLYILVVFITTGVLGPLLGSQGPALQPSLTPISDAGKVVMGQPGYLLLSIAAILAFISTANAGIMAASRYPMALSRDGLLPESLGSIGARARTPHTAILITGIFMIVAIFFKVKILVEAASTVLILTFMFSCFSVIIMRESHVQNYQPRFKAPFYPWVQVIGILGCGLFLFEMGPEAVLISIVLIVSGLFTFWFYGRIRATREFALLRLIERVTAREFSTNLLESELKEIIRERDEIVKDRFDRIIEDAAVLDIGRPLSVEELFRKVADSLGERLGLPSPQLLEFLWEREKESSTAITPVLAIPHIVIPGERISEIFLVRARKGVYFSEAAQSVHAIFVLAGTRDERNFHLRALSAIAQIVQVPDFDARWMRARNTNELKDVILLGVRKRYGE